MPGEFPDRPGMAYALLEEHSTRRHDIGTGKPCQAAGCPSRHTRHRPSLKLRLCDYHAGVFA